MKTAIVAALYLIGFITLVNSKKLLTYNAPAAANLNFERQPLISPEQHAQLDEFKRIKRQNKEESNDHVVTVTNAVQRFQSFLLDCKGQCAAKMGFAPNEIEKPLLFEENPTPKEKCLMACVLERTKIMNDENKVSLDTISRLAGMISNNNELVIAIARATADNCNRFINPIDKCEAASQINRCIAKGLRTHKIQIVY